MTEPNIRLIDELGAEFARVADEHEQAPHRFRRAFYPVRRRTAVAVALSAALLLGGGAYTVPVTRAAIEDLAGTFADWVAGDDEEAPGRALRPEDDAPGWVRERGGRLIAETDGVGLYVSRVKSQHDGTQLIFSLNDGAEVFDTIEGWREQFGQHAIVVLGAASVDGKTWDARARFPLLGVTARSVDRVELHYTNGPQLVATGLDGGFVLMADARRPLGEIVAYGAAGRELERTDVSYIDMARVCRDERGCPPGSFVEP